MNTIFKLNFIDQQIIYYINKLVSCFIQEPDSTVLTSKISLAYLVDSLNR